MAKGPRRQVLFVVFLRLGAYSASLQEKSPKRPRTGSASTAVEAARALRRLIELLDWRAAVARRGRGSYSRDRRQACADAPDICSCRPVSARRMNFISVFCELRHRLLQQRVLQQFQFLHRLLDPRRKVLVPDVVEDRVGLHDVVGELIAQDDDPELLQREQEDHGPAQGWTFVRKTGAGEVRPFQLPLILAAQEHAMAQEGVRSRAEGGLLALRLQALRSRPLLSGPAVPDEVGDLVRVVRVEKPAHSAVWAGRILPGTVVTLPTNNETTEATDAPRGCPFILLSLAL
ncbi:hypothetical protein VTN31DRAFT_2576 [Thermomyces dupontii]|uniref:uncharacterized protein n=1 Tax=Talaromyces thermophilus TaxID=28565 RepID=UPI00374474CF